MPELQDSTGRRVKWMRYSARILALIWAGLGSFITVFVVFPWLRNEGFDGSILWIVLALIVLIPWLCTAVAWRWETIGGVLLAVEGFYIIMIVPVALILLAWSLLAAEGARDPAHHYGEPYFFAGVAMLVIGLIIGTLMALPVWAAGALFLVSSGLKSRTPTLPQDSE